MEFQELVARNRSYRRFDQGCPVKRETLHELVALARLAPSAANLQPLKYLLAATPQKCARIFPHLRWAGYLKEWPGPAEGERPAACLLILGDTAIAARFEYDAGIAAQTLLLGAVEKGLGGCIIANLDRQALRAELAIPERFEILLVLALGRPAEEVRVEGMDEEGNVRYWRDEDGGHHVPKRRLEELILEL